MQGTYFTVADSIAMETAIWGKRRDPLYRMLEGTELPAEVSFCASFPCDPLFHRAPEGSRRRAQAGPAPSRVRRLEGKNLSPLGDKNGKASDKVQF